SASLRFAACCAAPGKQCIFPPELSRGRTDLPPRHPPCVVLHAALQVDEIVPQLLKGETQREQRRGFVAVERRRCVPLVERGGAVIEKIARGLGNACQWFTQAASQRFRQRLDA